MFYDVIRATTASDFGVGSTCLESDDGSDTAAIDSTDPASATAHFYLVRPENTCPTGVPDLGLGFGGAPRTARSCP